MTNIRILIKGNAGTLKVYIKEDRTISNEDMKRIKHSLKPKGETKYIRVNDKTLIEVDADMPDETARELYLHKLTLNKPVGKQVQVNTHLMKN